MYLFKSWDRIDEPDEDSFGILESSFVDRTETNALALDTPCWFNFLLVALHSMHIEVWWDEELSSSGGDNWVNGYIFEYSDDDTFDNK